MSHDCKVMELMSSICLISTSVQFQTKRSVECTSKKIYAQEFHTIGKEISQCTRKKCDTIIFLLQLHFRKTRDRKIFIFQSVNGDFLVNRDRS